VRRIGHLAISNRGSINKANNMAIGLSNGGRKDLNCKFPLSMKLLALECQYLPIGSEHMKFGWMFMRH
jgi:hypothetical protein